MPSHGVMVHGELKESKSIEVTSPAGNCCSGMHALKYAYMAVKSDMVKKAVSTGSERCGKLMRHDKFEEEVSWLSVWIPFLESSRLLCGSSYLDVLQMMHPVTP